MFRLNKSRICLLHYCESCTQEQSMFFFSFIWRNIKVAKRNNSITNVDYCLSQQVMECNELLLFFFLLSSYLFTQLHFLGVRNEQLLNFSVLFHRSWNRVCSCFAFLSLSSLKAIFYEKYFRAPWETDSVANSQHRSTYAKPSQQNVPAF